MMKQIKITDAEFAAKSMLSTGIYYMVALESETRFLIINQKGNRISVPKDKCEVSD
jgi:hypothetical protein